MVSLGRLVASVASRLAKRSSKFDVLVAALACRSRAVVAAGVRQPGLHGCGDVEGVPAAGGLDVGRRDQGGVVVGADALCAGLRPGLAGGGSIPGGGGFVPAPQQPVHFGAHVGVRGARFGEVELQARAGHLRLRGNGRDIEAQHRRHVGLNGGSAHCSADAARYSAPELASGDQESRVVSVAPV